MKRFCRFIAAVLCLTLLLSLFSLPANAEGELYCLNHERAFSDEENRQGWCSSCMTVIRTLLDSLDPLTASLSDRTIFTSEHHLQDFKYSELVSAYMGCWVSDGVDPAALPHHCEKHDFYSNSAACVKCEQEKAENTIGVLDSTESIPINLDPSKTKISNLTLSALAQYATEASAPRFLSASFNLQFSGPGLPAGLMLRENKLSISQTVTNLSTLPTAQETTNLNAPPRGTLTCLLHTVLGQDGQCPMCMTQIYMMLWPELNGKAKGQLTNNEAGYLTVLVMIHGSGWIEQGTDVNTLPYRCLTHNHLLTNQYCPKCLRSYIETYMAENPDATSVFDISAHHLYDYAAAATEPYVNHIAQKGNDSSDKTNVNVDFATLRTARAGRSNNIICNSCLARVANVDDHRNCPGPTCSYQMCGKDAAKHGECPDCAGYRCDGGNHDDCPLASCDYPMCGKDAAKHGDCPHCAGHLCDGGNHKQCPRYDGYFCQNTNHNECPHCDGRFCDGGKHVACTHCEGYLCDGGSHGECPDCEGYLCVEHSHGNCPHCERSLSDGGNHADCPHCEGFLCDDGNHEECAHCDGYLCDNGNHAVCRICGGAMCAVGAHDIPDCGHCCEKLVSVDHAICTPPAGCGGWQCDGKNHEALSCDHCAQTPGDHSRCDLCGYPLCICGHSAHVTQ